MMLSVENANVILGSRAVLHGFSMSISPGELVAVVGANGAGKSTALRVATGLIEPEQGRVLLEGAPLANVSRAERGRHIAYLPQDRTVHWALAAERVVALGRLPHRSFAAGESAADRAAIETAMQRMDVIGLKDRPVLALSGGERARVLVARALAQEARILVADEPTAGLDPAHSLSLFEELHRLAHEGHAVLTAMHDLSLVARFASRVLMMKDGALIADGRPVDVLTRDNLATAFGIDAIIADVAGLPVVLPRTSLKVLSPMT